MTDINLDGMTLEYSFFESMMDEALRLEIESTLKIYSEQSLSDTYLIACRENSARISCRGE